MEGPDDRDLVQGLVRGDVRAFDAAWERHHGRIHSFLRRMTGQRDVAEDLLQDTFTKLATHARTLEPDTALGPWLFTVARNLSVSWHRWHALDASRLFTFAILASEQADSDPHEHAVASEAQRRLERALARVAPKYREALLLVVVEKLEPQEAAQVLGLSPGALRQRLSRGRAILAETLAEGDPS